MSKFNFVRISKRTRMLSEIPCVSFNLKFSTMYLSRAFLALLPKSYRMVQLFWDKEQMVVGMYFNSAANKIPDNYQLSEHQGTRGGYRIVSRKLFSQMETTLENCKSKGSLLFVPELCEEEGSNRDFYIVRLVK